MRQFTDDDGRTWALRINAGALARMRDQADTDFLNALDTDGKVWIETISDPVRLTNCLLAIIGPQLTAAQVTPAEFLDSMDGAALNRAKPAFAEELTDFFCQWEPPTGQIMRTAMKAHQKYMDKAKDLVQHQMQSLDLDGQLDKIAEQAVNQATKDAKAQLRKIATTFGT